jgi:hypothetical protein
VNDIKMDRTTTYKIFQTKTLREKRYFWARNTFFTLFPVLFIVLYVFSGTNDSTEANNHAEPSTYRTTTEVSAPALPLSCLFLERHFNHVYHIRFVGGLVRQHSTGKRQQNLLCCKLNVLFRHDGRL